MFTLVAPLRHLSSLWLLAKILRTLLNEKPYTLFTLGGIMVFPLDGNSDANTYIEIGNV